MKKVLLFGAGKSATVLIDYLVAEAAVNNWIIMIADANRDQILMKVNNSRLVEVFEIDVNNQLQRAELIRQADIVISMMPPTLHFLVAKDCVEYGKNLLTASYMDASLKSLQPAIEAKQLLFICEMGLDPGLDHMSAMKLLNEIREKGALVTSFKSHCGGLVAPENDDNPWHYKISWNPRNIVMAGLAGAEYIVDNKIEHIDYRELFRNNAEVNVEGLGRFSFYPNRDSLSYLPIYELEGINTFMRTTLRHPSFCIGWDAIVQADLVNDTKLLDIKGLTFAKWAISVSSFVNDDNLSLLTFLGLFDELQVPQNAKTSADILQYLLETRLKMHQDDKDMIVMLHEIAYLQNNVTTCIESSLVVKGKDHLRTAMAKTVGLPLGIAAKLILAGNIQLSGIHIPTIKEIYLPILEELKKHGIHFNERLK